MGGEYNGLSDGGSLSMGGGKGGRGAGGGQLLSERDAFQLSVGPWIISAMPMSGEKIY